MVFLDAIGRMVYLARGCLQRRKDMPRIVDIKAREILDSRGVPTVEADVYVEGGICGRASVPSGASTGSFEAIERRDGNPQRFRGKGVLEAVKAINLFFRPLLKDWHCTDQNGIDAAMCQLDGSANKSRLGANAILAVSLAVARAAAEISRLPLFRYLQRLFPVRKSGMLPLPLINVLNGGAHAANSLDIQEFMIVPVGSTRFSEALRASCEVYYALKSLLREKGLATSVGDEGGVAPDLQGSREALDLLSQSVEKAGYALGRDFAFALDVAASELHRDDGYHIDGHVLSSSALVEFYEELSRSYPLFSLEDGLGEEDWEGWQLLTKRLGDRLQIVGDDLFVTSPQRLERGLREKSANAVLIKPNQIGTLTETLETCRLAQNNGWQTIISHRSGETEDTFIADLAVAVGAGQIKTGSVSRSERLAKYNRLMRIEEYLGPSAFFYKSTYGRLGVLS